MDNIQDKLFKIIRNNFYLRSFLFCLYKTNELDKMRQLINIIVARDFIKSSLSPHLLPNMASTSLTCKRLFFGMIRKRYFNEYLHLLKEHYGHMPRYYENINFITFVSKMENMALHNYINGQVEFTDSMIIYFHEKYMVNDVLKIKEIYKNENR